MFASQVKSFFRDESGQGITEYGAVLAFVAMLIALGLSANKGALAQAIQNSFSAVSTNLKQLATKP